MNVTPQTLACSYKNHVFDMRNCIKTHWNFITGILSAVFCFAVIKTHFTVKYNQERIHIFMLPPQRKGVRYGDVSPLAPEVVLLIDSTWPWTGQKQYCRGFGRIIFGGTLGQAVPIGLKSNKAESIYSCPLSPSIGCHSRLVCTHTHTLTHTQTCTQQDFAWHQERGLSNWVIPAVVKPAGLRLYESVTVEL